MEILTSTLSIVEVAYGAQEQAGGRLVPQIEAQIDEIWSDKNVVKLVEPYEQIAREARNLIRSGLPLKWRLRPYDAVHLATARTLGASEFHSYDQSLDKYSELTEIPIIRPYVQEPRLPLEGS